jgi:hypothetical protein
VISGRVCGATLLNRLGSKDVDQFMRVCGDKQNE